MRDRPDLGYPEHPDMVAPFRLVNGEVVDIMNLQRHHIPVSVIARALSNLCRFGGQLQYPGYTVAEHSIVVSYLCPPEFAYEGLMHDFTEGLGLVDLPTPVKRLLPEYKVLEAHVRAVMSGPLGLDPAGPPVEVKRADKFAFWAEQHVLQGRELRDHPIVRKAVRIMHGVDAAYYRQSPYRRFIERWRELAPDATLE